MIIKEPQVVILAGGLGTRLRPSTEVIPKPMTSINGKPFLEYQLNQVRNFGIKNVVLCVGYLGNVVEDFFKDGKDFGISIKYSYEKELLGTAGALKNAENLIESNPFIVMNGDCYTNVSLQDMFSTHKSKGSLITMAISAATNPKEQELVEIKNGLVTRFLKRDTPEHKKYLDENLSHFINAGVYVFGKKILDLIPSGKKFSLEQDIFPYFVNSMNSFVYNGYIKDLATIQFCREFEQDVLGGKINDC